MAMSSMHTIMASCILLILGLWHSGASCFLVGPADFIYTVASRNTVMSWRGYWLRTAECIKIGMYDRIILFCLWPEIKRKREEKLFHSVPLEAGLQWVQDIAIGAITFHSAKLGKRSLVHELLRNISSLKNRTWFSIIGRKFKTAYHSV